MPEYDATVTYRDIPNHFGYKAGSDGTIWSQWGMGVSRNPCTNKWRQLTPTKMKRTGYLLIRLAPTGITRLVHHLVLEAFVGPRPPGKECRHFPDPSRTNNHISNLQWGTRSENNLDKRLHGTTSRAGAKITIEEARRIREARANGEQIKSIAARYGLGRMAVRAIIQGKSWAE